MEIIFPFIFPLQEARDFKGQLEYFALQKAQ